MPPSGWRAALLIGLALALTAACAGLPARPPAAPPAAAVLMPTSLPATFTPIPPTATPIPTPTLHPLAIEALRQGSYPGSDVLIEQALTPGVNYSRAIASYMSEGLRIYALLTVPNGEPPAGGWPVIVFNHGYIPPAQYRTTERYVAYVDGLARSGYIVFRPDYRGHGSSDGIASGAYSSPAYLIDVLNAAAAVRRHPLADPARVGMWGHSMGGYLTLRAMVVDPGLRAGVIWAGVVASYPDMLYHWRRTPTSGGSEDLPAPALRGWRGSFLEAFGPPEQNPELWEAVSAHGFLSELSGPLQLHHGTADSSVPHEFSETLYQQALAAGAAVEFYSYPGADHNLSGPFNLAMARTVAFFHAHLRDG